MEFIEEKKGKPITKEKRYHMGYFSMSRYIVSNLREKTYEEVCSDILNQMDFLQRRSTYEKAKIEAIEDFLFNESKWNEKKQKSAEFLGAQFD